MYQNRYTILKHCTIICILSFYLLCFNCGRLSASSVLSCRKTISKEIKEAANVRRNEIKDILVTIAQERCLSLSPDPWSDQYKKTSYLGCTAHWVDSNWKLNSFE